MRPIPTSFHLGPLEVHTYGIGLALAFWFGYRYFEYRLKKRGFPVEWVGSMFVWVIISAILGARAMHVLSDLGYYSAHPGQILAIWQGGLSSFGGLLAAVPVAIYIVRKRCPELGVLEGLDIVAPVLMAAWAVGRLLGPQLMVRGGGHPTEQWFGMYYDGQDGKRLPVPLFQAVEDSFVYVVLILTEKKLRRWPDGSPRLSHPAGVVTGIAMILWGIERALDERLWLGEAGALGSQLVQFAGVFLVLGGAWILFSSRKRWKAWLGEHASGELSPATGVTTSSPQLATEARED